MRPLRSAARFVVVALLRRQHLLYSPGHRQCGIEVLVLDDRRLIDLPNLVEHPVGQDFVTVPDLEPAAGYSHTSTRLPAKGRLTSVGSRMISALL